MSEQRKIDVTELALRDGHQSLLATRMALEDMVPACADIDEAGYWSVECWGGATYDACIRFLNEDPWERLRTFRKLMPNSRLQMLLRGQNLLGYRHYEDTVVDRFVDKSAENGMDVFRVFDALNDVRNLRRAIEAVRRTGKHAQGTICYTVSPLHTVEGFVEMAEKLLDLGCDSICIKDMAALLKPQPAYDIVKAIKEDLRRGRPRPRALPRHHRGHAGQPDEGHRGRRRRRGHLHQLAEPRAGPQPHRKPGRDARGHAVLDRDWTWTAWSTIKDHFATVRPRYAEFALEHHRRRDRDLQEPDPRRHDLQHGEPAQAAGRRATDSRKCWRRCRGSARTPATRRWSRRRARSSARRPSSTC